MEIEKTSITTFYAVTTDDGKEITVCEMYDTNTDSYSYAMEYIDCDDEISEGDKLFNEILNQITNQ